MCCDIIQSLLNNPIKNEAYLRVGQVIESSGRFQLNCDLTSLLERPDKLLQWFDQSPFKLLEFRLRQQLG